MQSVPTRRKIPAMRVDTALTLVNGLVFLPEWKISATDHTKRFEDTICVRIDYPAVNTNRANAANGYDEEIMTYASFPVMVRDLNDVQLYREIANNCLSIWQHEIREALRVKSTLWAPFHPHRVNGIRNWQETEHINSAGIYGDLQFGLA